jgi:hypothetical protein
MLSLNNIDLKSSYMQDNNLKLQKYRQILDKSILQGEKFNLYTNYKENIEIVSFFPIKNLSDKTVAWIVSYTKSDIIKSSLQNVLIIRIIAFLLSILMIYFFIIQNNSNSKINEINKNSEKQRALFHEILNTTDNILLITDLNQSSQ